MAKALEHLRLPLQDEHVRPPHRAHVQRLVARIQDEYLLQLLKPRSQDPADLTATLRRSGRQLSGHGALDRLQLLGGERDRRAAPVELLDVDPRVVAALDRGHDRAGAVVVEERERRGLVPARALVGVVADDRRVRDRAVDAAVDPREPGGDLVHGAVQVVDPRPAARRRSRRDPSGRRRAARAARPQPPDADPEPEADDRARATAAAAAAIARISSALKPLRPQREDDRVLGGVVGGVRLARDGSTSTARSSLAERRPSGKSRKRRSSSPPGRSCRSSASSRSASGSAGSSASPRSRPPGCRREFATATSNARSVDASIVFSVDSARASGRPGATFTDSMLVPWRPLGVPAGRRTRPSRDPLPDRHHRARAREVGVWTKFESGTVDAADVLRLRARRRRLLEEVVPDDVARDEPLRLRASSAAGRGRVLRVAACAGTRRRGRRGR